jgi:hypothetical protein
MYDPLKTTQITKKTEEEAWLFFTESLREQEKQRSGLGWRQILCFSSSQPCSSLAAWSSCSSFSGSSSWVFLGVGGKRVESWWLEEWSVDGSGWMALLFL